MDFAVSFREKENESERKRKREIIMNEKFNLNENLISQITNSKL